MALSRQFRLILSNLIQYQTRQLVTTLNFDNLSLPHGSTSKLYSPIDFFIENPCFIPCAIRKYIEKRQNDKKKREKKNSVLDPCSIQFLIKSLEYFLCYPADKLTNRHKRNINSLAEVINC